MSFNPSQENNVSNNTISKLNYAPQLRQNIKIGKKAKNFVSSVFELVKEKINKSEQREKEIVSNFLSSLFEETENQIMVSQFIDSMLMEVRKEMDEHQNMKNKKDSKLINKEIKDIRKNPNSYMNDIIINKKLVENHTSFIESRQEEKNQKISFSIHEEVNKKHILKKKEIQKKALKLDKVKKKKGLGQNIDRRIEQKVKRIKQYLGKEKQEKIGYFNHTKEQRKEPKDKIKKMREKNNTNIKCLIQKRRVLRIVNKNIVPKKSRMINKYLNEINEKECGKKMEKNNLFKKPKISAKNLGNECVNKKNITKTLFC